MAWDHLAKSSKTEVVGGVMDHPPGKPEKSEKPEGKRTVEEVSIRKVDNGFTATVRYKDTKYKTKEGEERTQYQEASTKVFKNASDAIEILEECFG